MDKTLRMLRSEVLRELAERYTALPDTYPLYVSLANEATCERALSLAQENAPGRAIERALGMP